MTPETPLPKDQCPAELPAKPEGWRMVMLMHMSLEGGGIGVYQLVDEQGRRLPIQKQYDTRKPKPRGPRGGKAVEPGPSGFVILDATQKSGFWGEVVPWPELRKQWARWMAGDPNPSPDDGPKEATTT